MFFPNVKYRRQRPSIVKIHFATPIRNLPPRSRVICSATEPSSGSTPEESDATSSKSQSKRSPSSSVSTTTANTQPEDQFAERLAKARARVRLLYAHLVARLVDTATQRAQTVLEAPSTSDGAAAASVARRLRRDIRSLRSAADDALPADDDVWQLISRLQSVIEELERRSDADAAFARDRLQEDLEGGLSDPHDAGDALDTNDANSRPAWQPAATFRRTVSGVGEVIEERVAEFVRRDGSIDVDGLRGWARHLLDSIGMTWMRLNGRVPPSESTAVSAKDSLQAAYAANALRDEETEFHLREEIGTLEKRLNESSKQRENALRREDQLGKLIRARDIRLMDDNVSALRRTLAVRVLQLELEKIFAGVAQEIDTVEYDLILDQRVLVVEFGDLDARLGTLDVFVEQEEPLLIEDDTLGELAADIQDLKMRLGLDAPLYSSATLSWDQMRQFFSSSSKKARAGFDFYTRGIRLFIGDVRFAWRLISRTMTGYTPSAREVRTLRRTGRDLLTLVPFTIVLIAPLTPVGHVLIFSFLQRYWPEFFPSTFSERRQALMKKREQFLSMLKAEGEVVEDGDDFGQGGPGFLASVKRLFVPLIPSKGSSNEARKSPRAAPENGAGNGQSTDNSSGNADGVDERPVALSDLADAVHDTDKKARKDRIRVALDELHLAD